MSYDDEVAAASGPPLTVVRPQKRRLGAPARRHGLGLHGRPGATPRAPPPVAAHPRAPRLLRRRGPDLFLEEHRVRVPAAADRQGPVHGEDDALAAYTQVQPQLAVGVAGHHVRQLVAVDVPDADEVGVAAPAGTHLHATVERLVGVAGAGGLVGPQDAVVVAGQHALAVGGHEVVRVPAAAHTHRGREGGAGVARARVEPQDALAVAGHQVVLAVVVGVRGARDADVPVPAAPDLDAPGEGDGGVAGALVVVQRPVPVDGRQIALAVGGRPGERGDLPVGPARSDLHRGLERPGRVAGALVLPQHTGLVPGIQGGPFGGGQLPRPRLGCGDGRARRSGCGGGHRQEGRDGRGGRGQCQTGTAARAVRSEHGFPPGECATLAGYVTNAEGIGRFP
ncbi:hypothetical protein [Streptomyces chrestomyceticus]|uniref:hypothetical protein n=1 Tax=Streptomyces chrestomyceticus TaxID=68185 RepID=UPI0037A4C6D6